MEGGPRENSFGCFGADARYFKFILFYHVATNCYATVGTTGIKTSTGHKQRTPRRLLGKAYPLNNARYYSNNAATIVQRVVSQLQIDCNVSVVIISYIRMFNISALHFPYEYSFPSFTPIFSVIVHEFHETRW